MIFISAAGEPAFLPVRSPVIRTGKRGRPMVDGPSEGRSPRAQYQRDFMRKKRAAAKAKAT